MIRWGYVPGPFQFKNLLHLLNNQLCQDSSVSFFFFFEKVNKGHLKLVSAIFYQFLFYQMIVVQKL